MTSIKYTRKTHNSCPPSTRKIAKAMQNKCKICLRFRSKHSCRCKAIIVNQCWIITTNPVYRIRCIRHNCIKRFFISKLWGSKGISQCNIKLIIIDIVQKHIHTSKIICCMVYLLAKKAFLNHMVIKLFLCLQ